VEDEIAAMNTRLGFTAADWDAIIEVIPDALIHKGALWRKKPYQIDFIVRSFKDNFGADYLGWANTSAANPNFDFYISDAALRMNSARMDSNMNRLALATEGMSWQLTYGVLKALQHASPDSPPSIIAMKKELYGYFDLARDYGDVVIPYLRSAHRLTPEAFATVVRATIENGIDSSLMESYLRV